jgi:hypothetical protein
VRPFLAGDDYFVLENPTALPRAWVPRRVEVVRDSAERLHRLADPRFDPREVAFAEAPVPLPEGAASGTARFVHDEDERIVIDVEMATDGLVVLSDLWDPGWKVFVEGRPMPIQRVNHAFRGVALPRGRSSLEFRYEPASFRLGLYALLVALVLTAAWAAWVIRTRPSPAAGLQAGDGGRPTPRGP